MAALSDKTLTIESNSVDVQKLADALDELVATTDAASGNDHIHLEPEFITQSESVSDVIFEVVDDEFATPQI